MLLNLKKFVIITNKLGYKTYPKFWNFELSENQNMEKYYIFKYIMS